MSATASKSTQTIPASSPETVRSDVSLRGSKRVSQTPDDPQTKQRRDPQRILQKGVGVHYHRQANGHRQKQAWPVSQHTRPALFSSDVTEPHDISRQRQSAPGRPACHTVRTGGCRDQIQEKTAACHQHRRHRDHLVNGIINQNANCQQYAQNSGVNCGIKQAGQSRRQQSKANPPDGSC